MKKTEEIDEVVYDLVGYLKDSKRESEGGESRKIEITKVKGWYEQGAGWVIVVEGSPSRGLILVEYPALLVIHRWDTGKCNVYNKFTHPGIWSKVMDFLGAKGCEVRK